MKKTLKITINKILFTLEEDAYEKLDEYLRSLKEHYKNNDDGEDIIEDIEAGIAEKFLSEKEKTEFISAEVVEKIIKIMGSVKDITEEVEDEEKDHKTIKRSRKFYRDPDDKIAGGVCGGIGKYLGIDPLIVRLIFIFFFFTWSISGWIYILLWIIMPLAKTRTQKLEMRGEPMTLSRIENITNDIASKAKASTGFRKIIESIFSFIRGIFKTIGDFLKRLEPIARFATGIGIMIGTLIAFGAITFFSALITFNSDHSYVDDGLLLKDVMSGLGFAAAAFFGYLTAVLPLVFIFLVGLAIFKKRKVFNVILSGSLIGSWMISLLIFGVIMASNIPRIEKKIDEHEAANQETKHYDYENFSKLKLDGDFDIKIMKGENFEVVASGYDKRLEKLKVENLNDQTLEFSKKKSSYNICFNCTSLDPIKIEITMPLLSEIDIEKSQKVSIEGFDGNDLSIELNHARATIAAKYENIDADLNYNSTLTLNNSPKTIRANIEGYSEIFAKQYQALSSEFNVSNGSTIDLKCNYPNDQHETDSTMIVELDNRSDLIVKNLRVENLDIRANQLSNADLSGNVQTFKAYSNNRSRIVDFNLYAKDADCKVHNYSRIEVHVTDNLKVESADRSKFFYRGNPVVISEDTIRYGEIIKD